MEKQLRLRAGGTLFFFALCVGCGAVGLLHGQAAASSGPGQATEAAGKLKFVVIVSRHGVRSFTGKTEQLNRYSRQPWPAWPVPPGHLTAHGYELMKLFGRYDRELLSAQGLLSPDGCADAPHVRIFADSDQRTRETGRALASGLVPGCESQVTALPEGTPDPLFHPLEAGVGAPDKQLAAAAVAGRIGNRPDRLADAYRPQLQALERLLLDCDSDANCAQGGASVPQSLFDLPAALSPGKNDHLVELTTPLSAASTMAEGLLLEYAEGMDRSKVGWGRLDKAALDEVMQLHAAQEDLALRTGYIARAQASNLLAHALQSMEQDEKNRPVAGALTAPGDKVLILVGHDTNLANIAGALGLSWMADGRRDDTPPGGALVFELWRQAAGQDAVRVFFTAQTLDQMRSATPLSLNTPPERVPVFMPGCSRADFSCGWNEFAAAMSAAIDANFVK